MTSGSKDSAACAHGTEILLANYFSLGRLSIIFIFQFLLYVVVSKDSMNCLT